MSSSAPNYGEYNPELTAAVRRVARDEESVYFGRHAFDREKSRGIDHEDVLTCLRKGTAYGPEWIKRELRANVVHRGVHVRVAIAGLESVQGDWKKLEAIEVCTVMKAE